MSKFEKLVKIEDTRPESRLTDIDKLPQRDNEKKGSYYWRIIRHSVCHAIDVLKKADVKDAIVRHGVHHRRCLNHSEDITRLIYNKVDRNFITLDDQKIRTFLYDGRKKDTVPLEKDINGLVFATQMNLFIGYTHGKRKVHLMSQEFELISSAKCLKPIQSAIYNENLNELITLGHGQMTNWVFRYAGRHILPKKSNEECYDEKFKFENLCLEDTASRNQKLFAAYGAGVIAFNAFNTEVIIEKHDLHEYPVTAICFFNPLKYLCTGAKDGCIKVWNESWHVQIVFVGHESSILSLALYPYGPLILSSSMDNTIRVWSLETCDEVDLVRTKEPALSLQTSLNEDIISSRSRRHVDLWKVQNVHMLHTTIGHRVACIKATDHPDHPLRCILLCRDNSVRVTCPSNGNVLTTLLMSRKNRLVDAVYAIDDEIMFATFANGDIVKADTTTNPARILDIWKTKNPSKACNYLLIYEYVVNNHLKSDTWDFMKRAAGNKALKFQPGMATSKTLLIGGRKDGTLCVFNWENGDVQFDIEAHGVKGVLSMIGNSKNDQVISAGLDNIIKVWRVFPYSMESLAPLISFYCAHTPVHMSVMRGKLSVAFQEHASATYSIVLYNLQDKDRHDHGPEDDHMDTITGLSACSKMKLFASSSQDGTVRIWNEMNNLIRCIKLNAIPHSVVFCNDKGNLLVGIGDHVHLIDYKHYMPKDYRLKMVAMQFAKFIDEKPMPFDEKLLELLTREDVKRLKAARSSFKFTHFVDILTEEETEEVMKERKVRERAFENLEKRDEELKMIIEGTLEPKKTIKMTEKIKTEAFNKYLSLFYERPEIKLPDVDPYPEDTLKEYVLGKAPHVIKSTEKSAPEMPIQKIPTGFFPDTKTSSNTSIRNDCFIPNSVLAKLLWPTEEKTYIQDEQPWKPPTLSDAQLRQLKKVNFRQPKRKIKRKKKEATEERVLIFDYDDEDEKKTVVSSLGEFDGEKAESRPETAKSSKVDEETEPSVITSFMEKIKDALEDKSKTPELKTPPRTPTPAKVAVPESSARDVLEAQLKRKKELISDRQKSSIIAPPTSSFVSERTSKYSSKDLGGNAISEQDIPPASSIGSRTTIRSSRTSFKPASDQQPLETPAEPKPEKLPYFITQFFGEEWMGKYFPNCNENTMPKPWTVANFVTMIARLIRIAEYKLKVQIIQALQLLYDQHGIPDPPLNTVIKNIISVLNHHSFPPNCKDPMEKMFVIESFKLLHSVGAKDRETHVELIYYYLEGDISVRNLISDIWKLFGIKDPQNFFKKELDEWDIWGISEKDRPSEIRRMAVHWLEKWLTKFKDQLASAVEKLRKGEGIQAQLGQDQLKKRNLRNTSITQSESTRSLTVTFDMPPGEKAVDNVTYLDAINYFVDMRLQANLARIRGDGSFAKSDGVERNTVLVLPHLPKSQCLVRLGITHTSQCRPERETNLYNAKQMKSNCGDSFRCINLPMSTVYVDPFNTQPEKEEPVLLTLKVSQKYFVPSKSYVVN
ncbi:DgyrCDS11202 [Dimorphilus gyrociliatus]|uniref:DgyrCDS11202 n=1 Tax=Dimorphilus gyrociliatus TaxID=2664684 RepID=A0A7I8W2K0_9ANNE|nr:DgyrCDS11202 [Dimorphilus gyrociliatus]